MSFFVRVGSFFTLNSITVNAWVNIYKLVFNILQTYWESQLSFIITLSFSISYNSILPRNNIKVKVTNI